MHAGSIFLPFKVAPSDNRLHTPSPIHIAGAAIASEKQREQTAKRTDSIGNDKHLIEIVIR